MTATTVFAQALHNAPLWVAGLLIAGLVMLSTEHRWARICLRRVKVWTRKLHLHRSKPANTHPIVRGPE